MSEVSNRRFVHFDGTKEEFIDGGYPDQYQESIVFINGDGNESNNTIYTHGEYYGQRVIVEGDASNSAVLKGEYENVSNRALSQTSMAVGAGTTAGLKGWYYKAIQFNYNYNIIYLYLTKTQQKPILITGVKQTTPEKDVDVDLEKNDSIVIINGNKYDDFVVYNKEISTYGRISIKRTTDDYFPFDGIISNDDIDNNKLSVDDYAFYSKCCPLSGKISLSSPGSFSEGYFTIASGIGSHAEGKFNKPNTDSIHTVGIGTTESDRKNAHEITTSGKHYVYGIGNYDGTNINESKDIATYLPNSINITYDELVKLKNNDNLVPGQQYRIVDYVTTTTQPNTKSEKHQFDIIVTANTYNTLNESAKATNHDFGDENDADYFNGYNLSSWELKYSIDNDKNKFQWADDVNGKGVIYYLKDEHNNECFYDFKNIMFARYSISGLFYDVNDITFPDEASTKIKKDIYSSLIAKRVSFVNTKISQNVFPYVYPLVEQLVSQKDWGFDVIKTNIGLQKIKFFYTFSNVSDELITDYSLQSNTHDNIINPYKKENVLQLNNIVFMNKDGSFCYSNKFGDGCYENTLGSDVIKNIFDGSFYNAIIGDDVTLNEIGMFSRGVLFGNGIESNVFGSHAHYNILCDNTWSNTFDNYCFYNYIEENCYCNKGFIRNNRIILEKNCRHHQIGNNTEYISVNESGAFNIFGNYCSGISLGKNNRYNNFGNGCKNITLATNNEYNSYDSGTSDLYTTDGTFLKNTHIEGKNCVVGNMSTTPDSNTRLGYFSHAEGNGTIATGNSSHAEGKGTIAQGFCSHAEGMNNKVFPTILYLTKQDRTAFFMLYNYSDDDVCIRIDDVFEGLYESYNVYTCEQYSNCATLSTIFMSSSLDPVTKLPDSAINDLNKLDDVYFYRSAFPQYYKDGDDFVRVGDDVIIYVDIVFTKKLAILPDGTYDDTIPDDVSGIDGILINQTYMPNAQGKCSHTGGLNCIAYGDYSFSHGLSTITSQESEVAFGSFNYSDYNTLFSVGCGTNNDDRKNAFEITKDCGYIHGKQIIVIGEIYIQTVNNKTYDLKPYTRYFFDFNNNDHKIYVYTSSDGEFYITAYHHVYGSRITINGGESVWANGIDYGDLSLFDDPYVEICALLASNFSDVFCSGTTFKRID